MIQLRSGLEIVEVDDGKVVLDTHRGVYWHLNGTAIAMIEHLAAGGSLDGMVAAVVRDTGANPSRVLADYQSLLGELQQAKLVEGGRG